MDEKRRGFLKVAGVTALGGVALPVAAALGRDKEARRGSRLAMVIDLRRCMRQKGCNDCARACHSTHNVPDLSRREVGLDPAMVRRREVKWIWKEPFVHAFPTEETRFLEEGMRQRCSAEEEARGECGGVLVLCNHCDNPPCVRVCPAQATWKRREDGVVMMDMHRCVGCRYCVVACPYGSRSFNWRDPKPILEKTGALNREYPHRSKGVVEKCTFCDERLSEGRKPACVEACRFGAMVFGDLEDPGSPVRQLLRRRFAIRRKPALGTDPQVYYLV